tara:strand:+ start:1383 stop:1901 length:519 start_codon:yes stop_codon:yes gene_type:complete
MFVYIDNLEMDYYLIVAPLQQIAAEAERGGARSMIAREKFRHATETRFSVWNEFEDYADPDAFLDDFDDTHWMIFFKGPGIVWTEDVEDEHGVLAALIEDEENTLIVVYEPCIGYLYVVRSNTTCLGQEGNGVPGHVHPFEQVAVFDEDHADTRTVEGYSLPAEVLEEAIKI